MPPISKKNLKLKDFYSSALNTETVESRISTSLRVYITGVTGTGKTTVAERLSQLLNLPFLEINTIVLDEGYYLGYDITRDTVIIDEELLAPHLEMLVTKQSRIGLVGGIVSLRTPFDLLILLHCQIPILRYRLHARNYSSAKIEANVEAEIMNVLYYDALELLSVKHIIEVSTGDSSVDETCQQIISLGQKYLLGELI
ncbi:MAG: AAA family ATPase [Candidatus Thorarchaeota archaeon]